MSMFRYVSVFCFVLPLLFAGQSGVDAYHIWDAGRASAAKWLAAPGARFYPRGPRVAENVLVVAKQGARFTSIQAALDSITDARAHNRYLVYVTPGVYHEQVTMKPYVDIEGAGEQATRITDSRTMTLIAANNTELRSLTIENRGHDGFAIALFSGEGAPRFSHLTAIARQGDINIAILISNASPIMYNVTASASTGIYSVGVRNWRSNGTSRATIENSRISGDTAAIENHSTLSVTSSWLHGGIRQVHGAETICAVIYDATFTYYADDCP